MNVKRRFSPLQHLFTAIAVFGAAAQVMAQHSVVGRDNRVTQGQVVGVSGGSVQLKVAAGTIGLPLAGIARVEMPPPAEFGIAMKAYNDRNNTKAAVELKLLVDKYRGLPTDWARQASGLLGDVYVALDKLTEAENAYKAFQTAYPGQGSVQGDVGMARIAVARNDFAAALPKLEPVAEEALKQKTPGEGPIAYSQTFYLLGKIKEAQGDLPGALQDYLRTVTLFYQDPASVTLAQQAADELRKKNPSVTVP